MSNGIVTTDEIWECSCGGQLFQLVRVKGRDEMVVCCARCDCYHPSKRIIDCPPDEMLRAPS